MKEYRIEMNVGQYIRQVEADSFTIEGDWVVFWRFPATGGRAVEYWRAALHCLVSIETKRRTSA